MVTDRSKFNLSTKCLLLCTRARAVLDNLCNRIKTGEVTSYELSKIKDRSGHMKQLLNESLSDKDKVIILQILERRFREQYLFQERLHQLVQLCLNINIPTKGMIISGLHHQHLLSVTIISSMSVAKI